MARIQQDHLCDVHNFVSPGGVRVLEMEWVDGCDLQKLLTPAMLVRARQRVGDERWDYLNDVIVTAGPVHPRLKPGIAIAVLRDCLAALSALHRGGVVHGDVKPSNIMLKRTGTAKLIDIGAAFLVDDPPPHSTCTPAYAAPEILGGAEGTARSDLASLGYVLIEMLSGAPLFAGLNRIGELREAKRSVADRLGEILPGEVARNDLLMGLIGGLDRRRPRRTDSPTPAPPTSSRKGPRTSSASSSWATWPANTTTRSGSGSKSSTSTPPATPTRPATRPDREISEARASRPGGATRSRRRPCPA